MYSAKGQITLPIINHFYYGTIIFKHKSEYLIDRAHVL